MDSQRFENAPTTFYTLGVEYAVHPYFETGVGRDHFVEDGKR